MNKRLHTYLCQILAVWLIAFCVIVVVTIHSLGWRAVTMHKAKPDPLPTLVTQVAPKTQPEVAPPPAPAPKPQELPLLMQGKKTGSGKLGQPKAAWQAEQGVLTITMPYSGSLGEYTSFHFDRVDSLCFDFHGQWQHGPGNTMLKNKACPIRLLQTGQHGSYVRLSVVGRIYGKHEIRYSPTELIIKIQVTKPKALPAASATQASAQPAQQGQTSQQTSPYQGQSAQSQANVTSQQGVSAPVSQAPHGVSVQGQINVPSAASMQGVVH